MAMQLDSMTFQGHAAEVRWCRLGWGFSSNKELSKCRLGPRGTLLGSNLKREIGNYPEVIGTNEAKVHWYADLHSSAAPINETLELIWTGRVGWGWREGEGFHKHEQTCGLCCSHSLLGAEAGIQCLHTRLWHQPQTHSARTATGQYDTLNKVKRSVQADEEVKTLVQRYLLTWK